MKRFISCCLCMAALLTGCQFGEPSVPKDKQAQVSIQHYELQEHKTYAVERRDFDAIMSKNAVYQGAEAVPMKFGITGQVAEIYHAQGASVEAGTVIMELKCEDIKEQIRGVNQQIQSAKLEKEYIKKQMKTVDGIEKEEYEVSLDALEKSVALYHIQLKDLKEQLSTYQIIAPFDCVIRTLSSTMYESMNYNFNISNSDVACIIETEEKGFYVNADNTYPFEIGQTAYVEYKGAKIDVVLKDITKESDTLWVLNYEPQVAVSVNSDDDDNRGVVYHSFGSIKNALVIPKNCLLTIGDETYVYVVDDKGLFSPRKVKIGKTDGSYYEILDGVEEGELVLYE